MRPTSKIYKKWNLEFIENIEKNERFTVDKVKKKGVGLQYALITHQGPDRSLQEYAEQLRGKKLQNFNQIINSHLEDNHLYLQEELYSDFTLRDYIFQKQYREEQYDKENLSETLCIFLITAMLELHPLRLFLGALERREVLVSKLIEQKHEKGFHIADFKLRLPLHRVTTLGFSSGFPPESLNFPDPTVKTDVWSCGALLFNLLSNSNILDPCRDILQDNITSSLERIQLKSISLKNLIAKMLKVNPDERLSPIELVKELKLPKLTKEKPTLEPVAAHNRLPTSNAYETPHDNDGSASTQLTQNYYENLIEDTFGVQRFQSPTQVQTQASRDPTTKFHINPRIMPSMQPVQGEGKVQSVACKKGSQEQKKKKHPISKTPDKPIVQNRYKLHQPSHQRGLDPQMTLNFIKQSLNPAPAGNAQQNGASLSLKACEVKPTMIIPENQGEQLRKLHCNFIPNQFFIPQQVPTNQQNYEWSSLFN